jgi:hypothetical protein
MEVASMGQFGEADAFRRIPANSTISPDPRPFLATCGEHTRYREASAKRGSGRDFDAWAADARGFLGTKVG